VSVPRRARISFGSLLPGDVLVHRTNENDTVLVVRVGERLDLFNLNDGRFIGSWVKASSIVPWPYCVVRGDAVIAESADPFTL
jgi:hypothetical protein